MERHRARPRCLAAALASALATVTAEGADHTREVVRAGDDFGGPGSAFTSFIAPTINNAGAVVFNARLAGDAITGANNSGVYRYQLTAPALPVVNGLVELLREGNSFAAGSGALTPADLFLARVQLEKPVFNLAVPVVGKFDAIAAQVRTVGGLAAGDSVIVVEELNLPGFALAGVEGEDLPGGNGSLRDLAGFNLFGVGINGETGFFAAMNNTTGGTADDTALFRYQNGVLTELVREGDAPSGTTLSGVFSPRMNRTGEVAFLGGLASGDVTTDSAVFRIAGNGTATSRIVVEGDAVPGGDGEFGTFGEVSINGAGDVAWTALLRNTDGLPGTPFAGSTALDDSALYLARANGTLLQLAREGDEVSPGGARLGALADAFSGDVPRPSFNDDGAAAFRAELFNGDAETSTGIFIAAPDGLTEIARSGAAYDDGLFGSFDHPVINNRRMAAFKTEIVAGDVSGEEGTVPVLETALVVSDGIDFATVAREGDVLDGGTVFDIDFNADPTGPSNGFDDLGRVAYQVTYANGVRAINVWTPRALWRGSFAPPDGEAQWDDAHNWRFGMLPGAAQDADIVTTGGVIHGPGHDTTLASLTVGGSTRLLLGSGGLGTIGGLAIGADASVEGGGAVSGPVSNEGAIHVTPGHALTMNGELVNGGEIRVDAAATVRFAGGYAGSGFISGAGASLFEGGLRPGDSPTLMQVEGDMVLGDANETVLEIAGLARGMQYDALDVGGHLTLGGTLRIALLDGFQLAAGQSFLLFDAGLLDGGFADLLLPEIDGLTLAWGRDSHSLRLSVQAVPVPDMAWMFAAVALWMHRRRRP